jgi:hypothetical protein
LGPGLLGCASRQIPGCTGKFPAKNRIGRKKSAVIAVETLEQSNT